MKKAVLFCCCIFLMTGILQASSVRSRHFIIESTLPTAFINLVQTNAESYFDGLSRVYFSSSWPQPAKKLINNQPGMPVMSTGPDTIIEPERKLLVIYYSLTADQSQERLRQHADAEELVWDNYFAGEPAGFLSMEDANGQVRDMTELLRLITLHFIKLNCPDCPRWFADELAGFFAENARMVDGKFTLDEPDAGPVEILRQEIENGGRFNIKRLYSINNEQFAAWDKGRPFMRAFLYWLWASQKLDAATLKLPKEGFDIESLQNALGKNFGEINIELQRFIKEQDLTAEFHLSHAMKNNDLAEQEVTLQKAIEAKPAYRKARLALAKCYYRQGKFQQVMQSIEPILSRPETVEFRSAARLAGDISYKDKDYETAAQYYEKAWDASQLYLYKYRVAYQLGNCYYYLQNQREANVWYSKFLNSTWDDEDIKTQIEYAKLSLNPRLVRKKADVTVSKTSGVTGDVNSTDANTPTQ